MKLYNLKDDAGETKNLSATHPAETQDLYRELKDWQNSVHAKIPVPNPNFDEEKQWIPGWQQIDPKQLINAFKAPPK